MLNKVFMLLLICKLIICVENDEEHFKNRMEKKYVFAAFPRVAICNDYSDALYYIYKNPLQDSRWVIYIEGGGVCTSEEDCDNRWLTKKYYMSSKNYPNYIFGKDILSNSKTENEFHDYNKVLLPYCSSDSWLGNSRLVPNSNKYTKDYDARFKFTFQGRRILTSIIMDLLSYHGLRQSSEVVLAGSSAGGTGLLNHLSKIRQMIPVTSRLSVLIDSSWFINFKDVLLRGTTNSFSKLTGMDTLPACQDISDGYPCCFSPYCLIRQKYVSNNVPIFFVTSKYDIYMLSKGLLDMKSNEVLTPGDLMINVHSYGAIMTQQSTSLQQLNNLAFLTTSCFQHTYIVASSLWTQLYNDTVEFNEGLMHFWHYVTEGRWNTVEINGKPISRVYHAWYNNTITLPQNDTIPFTQWTDECMHAQCNPTCPAAIDYYASDGLWPNWLKGIIIILPLIVIILPLLIKIFFMVQVYKLKKIQAKYIKSISKEEVLAGLEGVPIVETNNYVGLSCLNLKFKSDKDKIGRVNNMKRKMSLANIKRNINIRKQSTFFNPNLGILNGISSYFNPGQLVAIMGPSGSGKTTFLDMLTGRRSDDDQVQEQVYINGFPMKDVKNWFVRNTGYVLQLATPYLKELTVRQNLTYCAIMRLPKTVPLSDKLWRVEQVLGQTGLLDIADVVVGDATGPGLSGGQKRRLCVAIQLLALPSVLFLDEPTSGLDSTSSLELLQTLHSLTLSGRLVIVTIHQPRIEIFHMFDRILFLCKGQVTFYGSPIMAPKMIAEALEHCGQKVDADNPADTIMDALTNEKSQSAILRYYSQSGEMEAISRAIEKAIRNPARPFNMKTEQPQSGFIGRLTAMECRASSSQQIGQFIYFPVVFLLYGIALGTCYFQTNQGILLMSCYQVFACASQLFVASVIHGHLGKTLPIFSLEKADGVGRSYELVLHTFVRITSQTLFPLIMCSIIIYFCTVVHMDAMKFFLSTVIHIQLSHVWITIIMFFACTLPRFSPLICPLLSAISGFSGGFLVPKPQMPWFYSWLFYINPTHWAYSAMSKVLLDDAVFQCEMNSPLECTSSYGVVILKQFGFENVNPYLSMVVLFVMFILLFIMTISSVELNYLQNTKTRTLPTSQDIYNNLRRRLRACWVRFRKRGNIRSDADIERLLKENEARLLSHPMSGGPKRTVVNGINGHSHQDNNTTDTNQSDLSNANSMSSIGTDASPCLRKLANEHSLKIANDQAYVKRQAARRIQRSNTNPKHVAPILKTIERSRTFNTIENEDSRKDSVESKEVAATPSPTWKRSRSVGAERSKSGRIAKRGLSMRATKKLYRNTRSSQYVVDKETLSKYLDSVPRSHEVYCSLSVVGKKPDKVKETVKDRPKTNGVVMRRPIVKRSDSIHVQTKASMVILAEKRKSMKAQMSHIDMGDMPDATVNSRRSFGEIRRIRFPYVMPQDQVEANKKDAMQRRPKSRNNSSASRRSDRAPPRYAFLADGNLSQTDDDLDDDDDEDDPSETEDDAFVSNLSPVANEDPLVQQRINSYCELREGLLISLTEKANSQRSIEKQQNSQSDLELRSTIDGNESEKSIGKSEYDELSGSINRVTMGTQNNDVTKEISSCESHPNSPLSEYGDYMTMNGYSKNNFNELSIEIPQIECNLNARNTDDFSAQEPQRNYDEMSETDL